MKTKLQIFRVLMCLSLWLPFSSSAQSLEDTLKTALSTLDTNYMGTPRLLERSIDYIPIQLFDGVNTADSVVLTGHYFPYAAGMMEFSKHSGVDSVKIDEYFSKAQEAKTSPKNYLVALCYEYDYIKDYALDSNLISWDSTYFTDVLPRSESPYEQDTMWAMALMQNSSTSLTQEFRISPFSLFGDVSGAFDSLEVDFDDGSGWRSIDEAQTNDWTVTYMQFDTFMVRI